MKPMSTDVKGLYDVIVVGSGPSGSVIANELTRAGVKCLMLEAGKYYPRDTLTRPEIDYYSQIYWSGGMELDTSCKNGIMRGKAVGGGTLAYQAIMCRFDEYVFSYWREKSGIPYFTVEEMEPWYKKADQLLPTALVDERYRNECCRIFVEGLAKLGYTARAELRAMDDCHWDKGNDCICCLGGCRIDGKGSMPHTVLKRALTQGLHLIPEFEVKQVGVKPDGVIVNGEYRQDERLSFFGRKLVLAGAPLGNTKLLLESGFKVKLPALGDNFYIHTQWFNCGMYDREINAHKGPFQVYGTHDPKLRQKGIKFENTFPPPGGLAWLFPGMGRKHHEVMRKFRYLSCVESSIRSFHPGTLRLDRHDSMIINSGLTDDEGRRTKEGQQIAYDVLYSFGAKWVVTARFSICPHHFGGLSMGVDGGRSCVDPEFHLHGFRNVYSADSSVFPMSTGMNPVLTILALSIKASQQILKEMA
ncbi:MAG: GMC family oxidoreductase [Candidatus Binatia bacterium]|jgi:choline dehydrogenase-like flavoprotein